jgi:hypothetical protein
MKIKRHWSEKNQEVVPSPFECSFDLFDFAEIKSFQVVAQFRGMGGYGTSDCGGRPDIDQPAADVC